MRSQKTPATRSRHRLGDCCHGFLHGTGRLFQVGYGPQVDPPEKVIDWTLPDYHEVVRGKN